MSIPPVSKEFIKAQIDAVRTQIGRNVTLCYPTPVTVSGYINPILDTSFDPPLVCTEVLARVHWVSREAITATPVGKYYVGEAQITVDPEHHELLQRVQSDYGKVIVDGQEMEIIKINPLGAPEINRIRAILRGLGERPTG